MTGEPTPDVDAAIDSFAQSAFRIRDERDRLAAENARLKAEREWLRSELRDWQECALYDAMMSGPVFKGWNRSALDRMRKKNETYAALAPKEEQK